jgi:hypothetical protein
MQGYKQFLNKDQFNSTTQRLKVTKVKETSKGFNICLFTNYVCIYYKYITLGKKGSAKVVTKVDKNYHEKYQFTIYENKEGQTITLKEFKELQN